MRFPSPRLKRRRKAAEAERAVAQPIRLAFAEWIHFALPAVTLPPDVVRPIHCVNSVSIHFAKLVSIRLALVDAAVLMHQADVRVDPRVAGSDQWVVGVERPSWASS